jgi:hypothetical protein
MFNFFKSKIMKVKVFLMTAMIVLSAIFSAEAQMFFGGSFGVDLGVGKNSNSSNGTTTSTDDPMVLGFSLAPQFGYYAKPKLIVGGEVGFSFYSSTNKNDPANERKTSLVGWSIGPFVRERVGEWNKLSIWMQSSAGLLGGSSKTKVGNTTTDGPSLIGFGIGVLPVVSYNLSHNLGIEVICDFLSIGFRSVTTTTKGGTGTAAWKRKVSSSSFQLGINSGTSDIRSVVDNVIDTDNLSGFIPLQLGFIYKF